MGILGAPYNGLSQPPPTRKNLALMKRALYDLAKLNKGISEKLPKGPLQKWRWNKKQERGI